jgi:hypothetical protein
VAVSYATNNFLQVPPALDREFAAGIIERTCLAKKKQFFRKCRWPMQEVRRILALF